MTISDELARSAPVLHGDRPIERAEDDLLGREGFIRQIVAHVRAAPMDDGYVIGLAGPWGSGKSSVLALAMQQLEPDAVVVQFEPWLFSGASELVLRFFSEISEALSGRGTRGLRRLGRRISEYGAAVAPAAGALLGPGGQLVGAPQRILEAAGGSTSKQRNELRKLLTERSQRIVVVVDDVDRLASDEIREIVRLVKLVGDLPGIVYLLSYERKRVEAALAEPGAVEGRAFLEKIVQSPFAMPPVSNERLTELALGWLDQARGDRELIAWNQDVWATLVSDGISGYLHTLRDGRRWANVAPAAMDLLGDDVATSDVLALEALRVFDPELHDALPELAAVLCGEQDPFDFRPRGKIEEDQRDAVAHCLGLSSNSTGGAHLLRHLFPAASHLFGGSRYGPDQSRWRKGRRVASRAIFDRYLHVVLPRDQVAFRDVEATLAAFGSPEELSERLAKIEDSRLPDLVARVRDHVEEAPAHDLAEVGRVFLGLARRFPRDQGSFSLEAERKILWMIEDLIERLSAEQRADPVRRLIDNAPSLTERWWALIRFGTWGQEPSQNPELDVLDADESATRLHQLALDIRDADGRALAAERSLLRLMYVLRRDPEFGSESSVVDRLDDEVLPLALEALAGEDHTHDEFGGKRFPSVDTDAFFALAGRHSGIARVERLLASQLPLSESALAAAEAIVNATRETEDSN
jgi:hypothetical protein